MAPYACKADQALMLYNSLTGEAEQELEHVSIEDLYTDSGVDTILNMLKSPMEQKMIYQKRKFLHEFENMRRYAGENMRAFINRFRRSQRNLKSVGIDISGTYDTESLGARLLDRSGLTAEQQQMILVGTQQSLRFEAVSEAMVLQFPDFRGAPPIAGQGNGKEGKSKGTPRGSHQSSSSTASTASGSSSGKGYGTPRKAWFTETADTSPQDDDEQELEAIEEEADEPNDQQEHGDDADNDDDDDPSSSLADLAEVLTVTAKKLSGLTLARGWSKPKTGNPKDKSRSVEDTKKVTHCTACGARGHWYQDPECPMNAKKFNKSASTSQGSSPQPSTSYNMTKNDKGKGKQHAVRFIHHDHGSMDIVDAPNEYGEAFDTFVASQVSNVPHQINEIKFAGAEQFAGFLVIDSGCQRTCCGKKWFDSHVLKLQSFGMAPYCFAANDMFQFGKGQPSTSTTRAYLPTGINGFSMILGASILEENIPLLGPNSLMTRLGAILDFGADWITFEAIGIHAKVHRIAGHLAVNILDFHDQQVSVNPIWQELAADEYWHDPDPELLLSSAQPELQHVPLSTDMVGSMEKHRDGTHRIPQEPHLPDHDRDQVQDSSKECFASTSISVDNARQDGSHNMQARLYTQVRQHSREFRQVPAVQPGLQVEQQHRPVGPSWVKRTLVALATIATTIFGDNISASSQAKDPSFIFSQDFPDLAPEEVPRSLSAGSTTSRTIPMDQLPGHDVPSSSSDRRAADGSLQHRQPRGPKNGGGDHLGATSVSQRGRLPGGQGRDCKEIRSASTRTPDGVGRPPDSRHRDGGVLRLVVSGLRKGTEKQLRGQWQRSAKLLNNEIQICNVKHKPRPPGAADLWELFAGEATCSRLARQYQLNALQPFDLIYGQDFMDDNIKNMTFRALKRHQSHLLMIELECTRYNLLNKNMNYAYRLDEWQMRQQEHQPLLDLSVDSALIQYRAGRFFLLENPLRSEVWSKPRVEELRHLPGVWEVVLVLGAFGATNNDGEPIQKPVMLVGNMPGLDVVLHQRLSQDEKALCVPVQGQHTRNSQIYPERLCRTILKELRNYVRQQDPDRFCTSSTALHVALPVQQPTADLSQWDEVVTAVDTAFQNTSKRPYYIMPDSPQGKMIQDLLRLNATRIQVVSTPTTRRLPVQFFDYVVRATFILYNDDSRAVEVEKLDEMQFPRQRFTKPVRIGIFVYGHPRPEPGLEQHEEQPQHVPAIMPGLPTDIDFPGVSAGITQEVRSAVARLHLNMGHPSKEELCQMMAQQGSIPDAAFECARKLRCATCERLRPPQAPRPSTITKPFMGQFGDEIQMDVVYCRTLNSTTIMILGAVDRATGFHQAALLPDRNASTTFETFEQMWLRSHMDSPCESRAIPTHHSRVTSNFVYKHLESVWNIVHPKPTM